MSDCVGESDRAQSTSSWCSTEEERNLRWSEDFALILISLIISFASLTPRRQAAAVLHEIYLPILFMNKRDEELVWCGRPEQGGSEEQLSGLVNATLIQRARF